MKTGTRRSSVPNLERIPACPAGIVFAEHATGATRRLSMNATAIFSDLLDAIEAGGGFPKDVTRAEALGLARRHVAFVLLENARRDSAPSRRGIAAR
jgi:hypothetical protein